MKRSRYSFMLELQSTEAQICLVAAQGDVLRAFAIRFSDGGEPFEIDNTFAAELYIEGPGGTQDRACEIKKDEEGSDKYYVYYPFTKETCAWEGLHKCQLLLFSVANPEDGLWSPQFSLFVGPKKKQMTT